jgi:hypothetical protein
MSKGKKKSFLKLLKWVEIGWLRNICEMVKVLGYYTQRDNIQKRTL